MCRYGFHVYKNHYACFTCRKAFARMSATTCPHCGGTLHSMGLDFKAPRRNDLKQWQKVEKLYLNGIGYYSCGCSGPGYRPTRLNQVDDFLDAREREKLAKDKDRRFLLHFDGRQSKR